MPLKPADMKLTEIQDSCCHFVFDTIKLGNGVISLSNLRPPLPHMGVIPWCN